jgi:hypothetical protein
MIPLILALTLEIAPATLMRTVAEGSDSPVRERLEAVLRTPVEWKALLHRLASDSTAQAIDFAHEMAVAVFVGPLRAPGARVDIFSVARENGVIVVRYRMQRPSQSASVAQIDTAPYQIIAVPRDRRHVRFIEEVDLTSSANRR